MINLGRSTSEYETTDIKYLFEVPENYKELIKQEKWLIIGRKGSGKSTLVDYRKYYDEKAISYSIRPGNILANSILAIYSKITEKLTNGIKDISQIEFLEEEISMHISSVLNFLVYTKIMREVIDDKQNQYIDGCQKTIYDFLKNNDLISGSVLYRSIKFIRKATKGLKSIENLSSILEDTCEPSFEEAVDCFYEVLREQDKFILLYIDNIDDYGFDYSVRNRAFFNALVVTTMKINDVCLGEKVPFRVVLTIPSELYENTKLWNRDKIKNRRIYIRWNNPKKMKNLINKRIAVELNIKKNKPRYEGDIYSTSEGQTWSRFFPDNIYSKMGRKEETFKYLLRHTLYTPRTMLDICSAVLNAKEELGLTPEIMNDMSLTDETKLIQDVVEDESEEIADSVLDIFGKMYLNIRSLIFKFKSRPNIWTKMNFELFVRENCLGIVEDRTQYQKIINPDVVIDLLYRIGFVGFGSDTNIAPENCENYNLSFSYISKSRRHSNWDIAVISPIFYDYIGALPDQHVTIYPHKNLTLPPTTLKSIRNYDIARNCYC